MPPAAAVHHGSAWTVRSTILKPTAHSHHTPKPTAHTQDNFASVVRRSSTAVTYASLADECFNGSPVARGAVDATIALGCFGFATSYLIVIGGLMPQVAEMLCGREVRV